MAPVLTAMATIIEISDQGKDDGNVGTHGGSV
jgi:hypothetical protein